MALVLRNCSVLLSLSSQAAKGTRQKALCTSLSFRMYLCWCTEMCVCVCACAWESSQTDSAICISEPQGTAASWHKSTSPLSCSSRMFPPGKNATPLAMNGVRYITEAKELEGLTTALLFVQHWRWLQDMLNLLQCSLGWALHFPDN